MARKDYMPEQAIGALREAEVRLSQGEQIGKICRGPGTSAQSSYRWRRRKLSCRQPVACPTVLSGQPTGGPERPASDSRTGIATGGRPLWCECSTFCDDLDIAGISTR